MYPLIAVDIGNSSTKGGIPSRDTGTWESLFRWTSPAEIHLGDPPPLQWLISSVHSAKSNELRGWIQQQRPKDRIRLLDHTAIPLDIRLAEPDRIGMDRLCAAAAARARQPNKPCIVVDAGTAVTIDAVSRTGEFLGGTISLGIAGALNHLAQSTAALPRLEVPENTSHVRPLGHNTEQAIISGTILSVAGGISNIVARIQADLASATEVFLTGGNASLLRPLLDFHATWNEHLVLEGIVIAARHSQWTDAP